VQNVKTALKRVAARMPMAWQQTLKRWYFARQLLRGRFVTDEKEFGLLGSLIARGDWVLDIGANVGHYTARMSDLVGAEGRVIAFEPVPATFELLASNVARLRCTNVTLVNAAASDSTRAVGMSLPTFDSGLTNFYMAKLGEGAMDVQVLTLAVDGFRIPQPIKLVKIDAEGHEVSVLRGMVELLRRDHPDLIVEDNSPEIEPYLTGLGYTAERLAGSSNAIFRWPARSDGREQT
jgi:FkbM family methyltransferase